MVSLGVDLPHPCQNGSRRRRSDGGGGHQIL